MEVRIIRAKFLIVGAGLSGLTFGYLLKREGIDDFVILDKETYVGGLCTTIENGPFKYDFTGHALHLNDNTVKKYILNDLKLASFLNKVERKAFILFEGAFIPYPFQLNLYYLPRNLKLECLISYLEAVISNRGKRRNFKNFSEFSYSTFGNKISEYFMIPYNRKLWTVDPKELGLEWMGKFLPNPDWKDVVRCTLFPCDERVGYNASFYYPKQGGIKLLPERIFECGNLTNNTILGHKVTKVNPESKQVTTDKGLLIKYEYLIISMPLDNLLDILGIPHGLKATTVIAPIVATEKVPVRFSWLYVPSNRYRVYRVGNFSFFSPDMSPDGCDLLYFEIAVRSEKVLNNTFYQSLKYEIMSLLKELGERGLNYSIIDVLHIYPAYVIYDRSWRETNEFKKELERLDIYTIGRYGNWKYDSMEGAIKDAFLTFDSVIGKCGHIRSVRK